MRRARAVMGGVCAMLACSCAAPIPRFADEGPRAGFRTARQQFEGISTVRGEGSLRLTRGDGVRTRLDSAFVGDASGRARVRAWKLGRAVFDAVIDDEGTWVWAIDDDLRAQVSAMMPTDGVRGLSWGLLEQAEMQREPGASDAIARLHLDNGGTALAELDLPTRTIRRIMIHAADGAVLIAELSRYRVVKGRTLPMLITLESESGRIGLRVDDAELNPDLAQTLFTPRPGATRVER